MDRLCTEAAPCAGYTGLMGSKAEARASRFGVKRRRKSLEKPLKLAGRGSDAMLEGEMEAKFTSCSERRIMASSSEACNRNYDAG